MVREMDASAYTDLCAVADIDPDARERFHSVFPGPRVYEGVEQLAADPEVEAVWLATPNRLHCEHAVMLANAGKHVMVQKPMAITLEEAQSMIDAADRNNVQLLAGHSQSFSTPIRTMRQIVRSGELGRLCAINVIAYNAWLLSPRKYEDLEPAEGGGVVYRNTPHQIDCIRLIGGGTLQSLRGTFGQWLPGRPSPGYSVVYMEFADGTPAVAIQNSYGYFFADELVPWGSPPQDHPRQRQARQRGATRKAFRDGTRDEMADYEKMGIGKSADFGANDFEGSWMGSWLAGDLGIMLVSCERGDIRQSPEGLYVYTDDGIREIKLPKGASPSTWEMQLRELYNVVVLGGKAFHSGRWGMGTLEVTLGIMESARTHQDVELTHQIEMDEE
jgi:phthalate 4,5-cis-dihydrodiol dehydrogenase